MIEFVEYLVELICLWGRCVMSLVVHNNLPSGIDCVMLSDEFFNARTLLTDTQFVRKVIGFVDKASYFSETAFTDRNGVLQPRFYLSTGSKTLINVSLNPDKCFLLVSVGQMPKG